jgi:hypothetical protein
MKSSSRLGHPGMAGCSDPEQSFHLTLLIGRVEVEMQAVLARAPLRNLLQGHVDARALGILEDHEVVRDQPLGVVVERFLPEVEHPAEVVAVDDNGADHDRRYVVAGLNVTHEAMVVGTRERISRLAEPSGNQ